MQPLSGFSLEYLPRKKEHLKPMSPDELYQASSALTFSRKLCQHTFEIDTKTVQEISLQLG